MPSACQGWHASWINLGVRRHDLAKRIASQNFGGWMATAILLAAIHRFFIGKPVELPVVLALGFGLFVVTPILYFLMRQYERLEE